MYNRLIKFINKYKLLYKYQFGFRKDHSTYMALIILVDKITSALDNGEFALTVLIDFRKAFDTVDHQILLGKLYKDIKKLTKTMNEELINIVNWLNANRLSLNIDKTNFMIFKPKNRIIVPIQKLEVILMAVHSND